ncbi:MULTISPECIES: MarR family winged helix-turn-helix transcriptional regulator [Bacillus subtilis group]|uniref:MarR family winged helix-turn-helix transcriptional regulator n=1 Tax=Bacillus subtilis group TaxID=653685 RepID=UPI001292E9FE|nr:MULTISPECIES: MarR family transcriptional regulator [Bacillus subtilis group]MCP6730569.1 MarR family transcriptional regulator [Bacillus subtilis]MDP0484527.1 MarR family transcriptional regulator [Bacillus subtilis]QFY82703.1 MarR family transcriptional regulator [Bacillus subtilis]
MNNTNEFMDQWLSLDTIQNTIKKELESILQAEFSLSIKEFYVLYYLSKSPDKSLRLQQLQEKIGLSQSALSRLVGNMEANSCGALEKHICSDDRRGTYTRLTELGENKLQKSLQVFHEILQKHLKTHNLDTIVKELINEL